MYCWRSKSLDLWTIMGPGVCLLRVDTKKSMLIKKKNFSTQASQCDLYTFLIIIIKTSLRNRYKVIHTKMLLTAAAAAKSLQSCPTLCDPIDGSPPGSPVPGILQARTLEWVPISFSSAWKWKVKVKSLSRVRLLAAPWTIAYRAPPSMGFSRQEYWSGVSLPSPTGTN